MEVVWLLECIRTEFLKIYCFFIEVELIYNVMLVSGIQHGDSDIHMCVCIYIYIYIYVYIYIYIYIYILFQILFSL